MINRAKSLYCAAIVASLVVGCGKAKKETVYVAQPPTSNGQPNSNQNLPTDPASQTDLLAVQITNFSQLSGQAVQNGAQIEFGLRNVTSQVSGIQFKCSLDQSGSVGANAAQTCTSPYTVRPQTEGQYTFTVYAVHSSSGAVGNASQVNFTYGAGYPTNNGPMPTGNTGSYQNYQVGDLLMVNVPYGMHMVYHSQFLGTGFPKFRIIDGSMNDSAAPYPIYCRQQQTGERLIQDRTLTGMPVNYCEMSQFINPNSPGSPMENQFRWMNMNTMAYNSFAMASDATLGRGNMARLDNESLAGMYVNVFTNMTGRPLTQAQAPFTNEFSQTVSRLQMNCGSEPIRYIGTAPIWQGYFNGTIAVNPMFGCTHARDGKWFVSIGSFPMDRYIPTSPTCDWNCWSRQNFTNVRAAEIVVEYGPYEVQQDPVPYARKAQDTMLNNLRKLSR